MQPPANSSAPPPSRAGAFRGKFPLPARLRSASLATQHVAFSVALTAGVVALAGLCALILVRGSTRRLIVEGIGRTQAALLEQQKRAFETRVRSTALAAENPTLRAALDVRLSERQSRRETRPDLLVTIQNEIDRMAAGIEEPLIVLTDERGEVVAVGRGQEASVRVGDDLSGRPAVRRALAPDGEDRYEFVVMAVGPDHFEAVCIPILLQGYVLGTVILGERVDHRYLEGLRDLYGGEVVVTVGDRAIASTIDAGADRGSGWLSAPDGAGGMSPARIVGREGADYVVASLRIGEDEAGRPGTLHLLHPLDAPLRRASEPLLIVLGLVGAGTVAASGALAWGASRSTLRPLQDFVAFMRSVAESGDQGLRCEPTGASREIGALSETYNRLMDSLERTKLQLFGAREDLSRLERLRQVEKMAALGTMLAGAAHEINNPLAGVVGHLELLLGRDDLEPETRRALEKAHGGGRRVVALVRNLLQISRRGDTRVEKLDVHRTLSDAVALCEPDYAAAGVALEVRTAAGPAPVMGSELGLQQVFVNIVRNALDALREGREAPRLLVRTRIEGGGIAIEFEDNGPGLRDPGKVFEPFYTTKEAGKGTGLGLSICFGIVQEHGGTITAHDAPGGGALFRVTLPRVEEASTAPAPEPPGAAAGRAAPIAGRPLEGIALVVEDEELVMDLHEAILTDLGLEVVGARNGPEALRLLASRSFDLIVSDYMMPGDVSGQDLHRWVGLNRPALASRFIFVTGDTMGVATRAFIETSGVRFVAKPFTVEEIVTAVREVLHEARAAV